MKSGVLCVPLIAALGALVARADQTGPHALRTVVVPLLPQQSSCPSIGPAGGVRFPVDAGASAAEWLAQPDAYAFLAVDRNKNGAIDNASELVSDRMADSGGALDVLVTLATASAPNATRIGAGHPFYSSLILWSDANRNGRSDQSELRPLSEFLAVVGLGVERLPPASPTPQCRYRAWAITTADWTGRPRPDQRLHHIYEVVFRTRARTGN